MELSAYTTPQPSPLSITSYSDIKISEETVYSSISKDGPTLAHYDAVLIAGFGTKSLVSKLSNLGPECIMGVFEASILTAQTLLRPDSNDKWGIVTLDHFWESYLMVEVKSFLGQDKNSSNDRFACVFSAKSYSPDPNAISQEDMKNGIREATGQLLQSSSARCVVIGCIVTAELEDIVRSTATEFLGKRMGEALYVINAIKAGILKIQQMVRCRDTFK
jgi:Asp/Glu/hydantoin racemase